MRVVWISLFAEQILIYRKCFEMCRERSLCRSYYGLAECQLGTTQGLFPTDLIQTFVLLSHTDMDINNTFPLFSRMNINTTLSLHS